MSALRSLAVALLALTAGLALGAATATGAGAAVVLNEVNCEGTDWIELANTADGTADVSGWLLTDDPLTKNRSDHRFVLPGGTSIPGHGTVSFEKGAGGFPFGVSCGDDTIRLADTGPAIVDEAVIPNLPGGATTWGRFPDGTGTWQGTVSSRNAANVLAGGSTEDQLATVLDPGSVSTTDLRIPQASRAALAVDPTEYVPATFTMTVGDATYGPYAVGVRLKGNATFRSLAGKASLKVKFNWSASGQRFLGLKTLVLNSMIDDHTMIHETLGYATARGLGIPAPRTGYSFVTVDDEPFGVYLSLEPIDDVLLARWFPSTGHLYEGTYGQDVAPGLDDLEVDEGDEDDRGDLDELMGLMADGDGGWDSRVSGRADLDEMTLMWAMEHYIGHWDGYSIRWNAPNSPNNYYLHSDASGRFSMLPWGLDSTFWAKFPPGHYGGGRLYDQCVADATCRARYLAALETVKATVPTLDLPTLATAAADMLRPWQAQDPRRETTQAVADEQVAQALEFLASRRTDPSWTNIDPNLDPPVDPPYEPPVDPPYEPPVDPPVDPPTTTTPTTSTTPKPPPGPVVPKVTVTATRISTSPTSPAIATSVKVTAPGTLRQRTTAKHGSSVVRVCLTESRVRTAGTVATRCRLSSWARRYVRDRASSVTVSTTLTPARGRAINHTVTVRTRH